MAASQTPGIGFRFQQSINRKLNLRLLDDSDLENLSQQNLQQILHMVKDIGYIDITKDPELQSTTEAHHLHKVCQYTMQYLLYSIEGLQNQEHLLSDNLNIEKINSDKLSKVKTQQESKIEELEEELRQLEDEVEHEKYLIAQEKIREPEKKEKVEVLVDKVKSGLPKQSADEDVMTKEMENFKSSFSQFNHEDQLKIRQYLIDDMQFKHKVDK